MSGWRWDMPAGGVVINLMPISEMRFQRYLLLIGMVWAMSWLIAGVFTLCWRHQLITAHAKKVTASVLTSSDVLSLPVSHKMLNAWRKAVAQRHQRVEVLWQAMRLLPISVQLAQVSCQTHCEWLVKSPQIKSLRRLPNVHQLTEQEGGWFLAHMTSPW